MVAIFAVFLPIATTGPKLVYGGVGQICKIITCPSVWWGVSMRDRPERLPDLPDQLIVDHLASSCHVVHKVHFQLYTITLRLGARIVVSGRRMCTN